jgi:hypothetical protein
MPARWRCRGEARPVRQRARDGATATWVTRKSGGPDGGPIPPTARARTHPIGSGAVGAHQVSPRRHRGRRSHLARCSPLDEPRSPSPCAPLATGLRRVVVPNGRRSGRPAWSGRPVWESRPVGRRCLACRRSDQIHEAHPPAGPTWCCRRAVVALLDERTYWRGDPNQGCSRRASFGLLDDRSRYSADPLQSGHFRCFRSSSTHSRSERRNARLMGRQRICSSTDSGPIPPRLGPNRTTQCRSTADPTGREIPWTDPGRLRLLGLPRLPGLHAHPAFDRFRHCLAGHRLGPYSERRPAWGPVPGFENRQCYAGAEN